MTKKRKIIIQILYDGKYCLWLGPGKSYCSLAASWDDFLEFDAWCTGYSKPLHKDKTEKVKRCKECIRDDK